MTTTKLSVLFIILSAAIVLITNSCTLEPHVTVEQVTIEVNTPEIELPPYDSDLDSGI